VFDVFVPTNPFRGFGFITYSAQEDAMRVLDERRGHKLKGASLNITAAQPKADVGPLRQENYGVVGTHGNGGGSMGRDHGYNQGPPQHYDPRGASSSSSHVADDLKDMLRTLIGSDQRRR
jgi:RNA recognition motif-containing protein